jgi:hypothetical protein
MSRAIPLHVGAFLFAFARTAPLAAAVPLLEGDDPTDPYALPDAPAPPTLPDLTHRALAASLELTFASIRTGGEGAAPARRTFGAVERLELEQALSIRRWYLGAAHEVAVGSADSGGPKVAASHPEIWGRAVWASAAGLAYGGGIGVVFPIANHDSAATAVAESVGFVRPWDYVAFLNNTYTLRPFIDVRDIDGPVMLQLRQGIDWAKSTLGPSQLTSRTTFFIGYRPTDLIGLGLEAWEVYFIEPSEQRPAYAVSPSVRLMTKWLQPAASLLFPLDRPLLGAIEGYWALRLSLGVVIDPSAVRGK